MMVAPAAVAAAITAAWRVSMDTVMPLAAKAETTGSTRAISSLGLTVSEPGRVDSPPTSMMTAPASTMARAELMAVCGL